MTNLANDTGAGGSADGGELPDIMDFDFDTPDEASMQLLEDSWLHFCHTIGLQDIPDLRAILAAHDANPPQRPRRHWLVRPFVAAYEWLTTYP
jgi:hypothetical protein